MTPGGRPEQLAPGLWASAVPTDTLPPWHSTHALVIGGRGVGWLVDPGGTSEAAAEAIDALLLAAGVRTLKGVLLTHTHADHRGGIPGVRRRHGPVPVLVHPAGLGRLPDGVGGRPLLPGRRLMAGPIAFTAVGTPGHATDHLAFWLPDARALVAGDLVAGRGSSWVGLPDGSVAAYLDSLQRAAALGPEVVVPGHGPPRRDGRQVLDEARAHRLARERDVWTALADGPRTLPHLRERVYPGLEPDAHDLAERSLAAHLVKLMHEARVMHLGSDARGPFARAPGA